MKITLSSSCHILKLVYIHYVHRICFVFVIFFNSFWWTWSSLLKGLKFLKKWLSLQILKYKLIKKKRFQTANKSVRLLQPFVPYGFCSLLKTKRRPFNCIVQTEVVSSNTCRWIRFEYLLTKIASFPGDNRRFLPLTAQTTAENSSLKF